MIHLGFQGFSRGWGWLGLLRGLRFDAQIFTDRSLIRFVPILTSHLNFSQYLIVFFLGQCGGTNREFFIQDIKVRISRNFRDG